MPSLARERLDAGIEVLRLDRPEVRNALDTATLEELLGRARGARRRPGAARPRVLHDEHPRAVGGRRRDRAADPGAGRGADGALQPLLPRLEAFPVPTVAVCVGNCVGAGAELAAGADLRVGGDNLKLAWAGRAPRRARRAGAADAARRPQPREGARVHRPGRGDGGGRGARAAAPDGAGRAGRGRGGGPRRRGRPPAARGRCAASRRCSASSTAPPAASRGRTSAWRTSSATGAGCRRDPRSARRTGDRPGPWPCGPLGRPTRTAPSSCVRVRVVQARLSTSEVPSSPDDRAPAPPASSATEHGFASEFGRRLAPLTWRCSAW